jgi:hypothetical protein
MLRCRIFGCNAAISNLSDKHVKLLTLRDFQHYLSTREKYLSGRAVTLISYRLQAQGQETFKPAHRAGHWEDRP